VTAVCAWAGDRIGLHLGCSSLDLRAAWMPSHDEPATCCLGYRLPCAVPSGEVAGPPVATWVSAADVRALSALQSRIEDGERLCIVGTRDVGATREYAIRERVGS